MKMNKRCWKTLALYRSYIHHDHADWLETKLALADGWDGLHRRYLLASDAAGEKIYLHSFIAAWLRKRQGAAEPDDGHLAAPAGPVQQALLRRRHMAIAECWLQQLGQANRRTQLNIERALESFHHLLAAGAGARLQEVSVKLLHGERDWALKKIEGFYEQLFRAGAPVQECAKALEYWLALDPQEAKAWCFLGECHVKLGGWSSPKALECFERACQLLPSFPQYWVNLGRAMREHGQDSAAAFLQRLEQVERDYPQAINNHVQAVRVDCKKVAAKRVTALGYHEQQKDSSIANNSPQVLSNTRSYIPHSRTVLTRLPPKTQIAVEYLRCHSLPALILSGKARVFNSIHDPVKYKTTFQNLGLSLTYYQDYKNNNVVIIDIEIIK